MMLKMFQIGKEQDGSIAHSLESLGRGVSLELLLDAEGYSFSHKMQNSTTHVQRTISSAASLSH